jgi:predicted PurR-regulated permease PerM
MKAFAWKAFLAALTLGILIISWQFRTVVIIFLLALAITAATRPLVESFDLGRISRGIAMLLVHIALLGLILMIFAAVGSSLGEDFAMLGNQLTMAYEGAYNYWPEGNAFQRAVANLLPPPQEFFDVFAGEPFIGLLLIDLTTNLISFITEFAFVIILSIYWSIDRTRFERMWLSLLAVETRTWARNTYRDIENEIGVYIRSMFVRAILSGLLIGIGLSLFGVNYATLLAILGALFSLIPWLGILLVVIPVFLSGLTTSIQIAALAAAYAFIVMILLEVVIVPKIVSRGRYSSLLMILIAIMLFEGAGLLALVLAPPLSAAIQLVVRRLREVPPDQLRMRSIRQIAHLRTRVDRVQEMLLETEEDTPPYAASMMQRLEKLVNEADSLLPVDVQEGSQISPKGKT